MSYSNISGLELFSDPFSRPQAYSQPPSCSSSPAASRPKTTTTQTPSNHQTAQPTHQKPVTAPVPQQSNIIDKPTTPLAEPAPQEKAKPPVPAPVQEQKPTASTPALVKAATPADTQPEPKKKTLELDMSTGSGTSGKVSDEDDLEKRKAHEETETKRKAEFDERQLAKKQAEEASLQKLNTMSDADIIAAAAKRVSTDTERLTRRNMKECVAEHIQALCKADTAFARKAMHPRKTMIKCFKYINRMARDYVKQEMENNDIQPDGGGYGCDVPDGLCYQWAEDYFNSTNIPEDQETEEKFVPKPYTDTPSKPAKQTEKKPKTQEQKNNFQQMSLF